VYEGHSHADFVNFLDERNSGGANGTLAPPFFTVTWRLYTALSPTGRKLLIDNIPKAPTRKELIRRKLELLFSEPPKTFGDKLKYWRLKNNLLQKDLARILKVHEVTICRYEKNLTYPSGRVIQKINRILNAHSFVNSILK